MAIQLRSPENGERSSEGRQFNPANYRITYFNRENFLLNIGRMVDLYTEFGVRDVGWSPEYARELALKGLGVEDLTRGAPLNEQTIDLILEDSRKARMIPNVALLRKVDLPPGQFIAFSAHRMYYPSVEIDGVMREVPVNYHVFRAIDGNERGQGIGRATVEFDLVLNNDAEFYFHRTGNHVAAYANTQVEVLDQGTCSPWELEYPENPALYRIIRAAYAMVRGGAGPDMDKHGVVRNAYREPNRAIEIRYDHKGSMRIHHMMFRKYRMRPLDGIVAGYKVA